MRVIGAFVLLVAASFPTSAEPVRLQPVHLQPAKLIKPATPAIFEFDLQFACDKNPAVEMAKLWPRIASLCSAVVPSGGTTHCQSSRASEFGTIHFISKKCSLLATAADKFCVEKIVVKEAAEQPVLCVEPVGVTFEKFSESAFLEADQELFKYLDAELRKNGCELIGEAEKKVIAPEPKLQQNNYIRRFFWPSTNCFLKNGAADCASERYEPIAFQVPSVSGERVLCRLKGMKAKGSAPTLNSLRKNNTAR